MKDYDPSKIESKWQKEWAKKKVHTAIDNSKKKKFYGLIEFPYPSGEGLHVGHVRSNTAMDVIARKRRMEGFNVLYPIGWDAFGLPTENYAIKTGVSPVVVTKKNTDTFRRQLQALGFSFDWSREINTTDPKYYKWTQWLFLQFLKHDLAYKDTIAINWCPKDKIGLANEEVINGRCERCGTLVEKREKEQWMLRITKYADKLDKDLDKVDFLEKIKLQQHNWIGRSEGAEIDFKLVGSSHNEKIKVFTTRPDTLFGATYIVLAPEHPLIQALKSQITNFSDVQEYVVVSIKKEEIERTAESKDKTGVEIKGIRAINPANGEEIPVWVSDYVLATYGTGAVMAVPAHDERDFDFAKKYNLPIREVIEPLFTKTDGDDALKKNLPLAKRNAVACVIKHWKDDTYLCLKWKKLPWAGFVTGGIEDSDMVKDGVREIMEETGYKNLRFVRDLKRTINVQFYHVLKKENRWARFHGLYFELTDGERVPVSEYEQAIHDIHWVPKDKVEDFLSVPDMKLIWREALGVGGAYTNGGILKNSGKFNGKTSAEIKKEITQAVGGKWVTRFKLRDWVFSRQRYWGEPIPVVHCEKCGIVPVPEKDLPVKLPKVDKYEPSENGESPLASISRWVNTTCPKCKGKAKRETDVMPNWAGSSWYFLRYIDPNNNKKFADLKKMKYWMMVDWYNGGMEHTTLHLLYSRFWNKFFYDIGLVPTSEPYKKRTSHGLILAKGGEKMSKSKGNVINPDSIISVFGADTLRMYEMFMGPFDQPIPWGEENIIGVRRFLEKVWRLSYKVSTDKKSQSQKVESLLHKTIQKVSHDIENLNFNTAVSSMMILVNEMEKQDFVYQKDFELFLKILSPFTPHIAEEIWHTLGHKTLLVTESWPKADPKKMQEDEVTIVIQINSKIRAQIICPKGLSESEVLGKAKILPDVDKWLIGKQIFKTIYVQDKLVNIVVN